MSDGEKMSGGRGYPYSDVEAPPIHVEIPKEPPVAVAFVPPRQEHRGSISSASDASVGVMSTASGEDLPFPGFLPITFGVFSQTSRLRFICLTMITNSWFERISMIAILLNCITLGMYQPCVDDVCDTYRCRILTKFDDAIFIFFAIEMLIKMIAMGVTGKGSYLADTWNRLDCFIVAAGFVEYFLVLESNVNLSAIRTIRVLRPLRAINRIPSMRILVMLLLDTLPMLGNVLLLCFFVFFIFGIVGVQLWKGMLRQRCFLILPDNVTEISEPITNYYNVTEQEKDYICSLPKDNGMHSCSELPPLKHKETSEICTGHVFSSNRNNESCINWNQYYTECRKGTENPYHGGLSFDNIGHAWVAIFLVISLEGWTDIMYYVQDGHSFWDFIYFVLLIVIGSFFMINLCLVVIATQFSETKKREMERMKLERARFQSSSTLASGSMSDQTSCYAEILKYIAHLWRRLKRRVLSRYRQFKRRKTPERPRHLSLKRKKRKKHIPHISVEADNSPNAGGTIIFPSANYKHRPLSMIKNLETNPIVNITPTCQALSINETRFITTKASPDVSDAGGSGTPRRSVILKVPGSIGIGEPSGKELLSPSSISTGGTSPRRRRSSVMFSDVILLHGNPGDTRNVCLSEKTTQTEPEEPLDPSLFSDPLTSPKPPFKPKISVGAEVSKKGSLTCGELLALSGALSAALPTHMGIDTKSVQNLYSSLSKGVKHFSAPSLFYSDLAPVVIGSCPSDSNSNSDSESEWSDDVWTEEEEEKKISIVKKVFTNGRRCIKVLVDHRYFQRGILIAILINTLSMGVEYHNQPEELTQLVEISNIIFSGLFGLEMLLKIIAEGPFGYISNGFNVFDGIIVILSMIELYESYGMGGLGPSEAAGQGSSLSVLRTFRLLRILKLVRFLPQLRRQLFVMLRTMDNVAIFFSLLVLFIFIFSILGMNLFGCKFCTENEDNSVTCERKNFDSLLWASITVFQILTQEDWNIVLFNGMEKTNHWASLYFVALMTFGNYVLFNLLVAILVEGFSAERRERDAKEQRDQEKQRLKELEKLKVMLMEETNFMERALSISPEDTNSLDDVKSHLFEEDHEPAIVDCGQEPPDSRVEEEKKRSRSSLENGTFDEEKKALNTNEERSKENQLRRKLLLDDPKCNIEKEHQLLQHPGLNKRPESSTFLNPPPLITHTAASPQGSPHVNLEQPRTITYGHRLSPAMAMYCPQYDYPNQKLMRSASTRSNYLSPRMSRSPSRLSSIKILNRADSSTSHSRRRMSLSPSGSLKERQNSTSPLPWKNGRGRKRIHSASSSGNRKKLDCQSLMHGSWSDEEVDITLNNNVPLNNNNHWNNRLPSPTCADHSQCNGSMGGAGCLMVPKKSILTQQNSIGLSKSLSPQSSFKSQHSSNRASPHRLSIRSPAPPLFGVPEKEFKTTNLNMGMKEQIYDAEILNDVSKPEHRKIFGLIEPKGCFLDREDYSLYIFAPDNPIRRFCTILTARKWFDGIILIFIGMNCITLAMERPNIPPDSGERLFLGVCNDIFTVVFALEMLVKVIAQGMFYGQEAYFSSGWNIMDGSLVVISLVDFLMSFLDTASPRIFGILRVFRLLRALRPLRVINRAPGLKLVVQTLLSSLQPIGNIVLICCTFFIIFGILGVQLFKGSFYYCEGPDLIGVKTKSDCLEREENKWVNRKYNFDNLGQALMALFVLSSKDGWVNIMYTGLDAVGVDKQPVKDYSLWRLLYFISFLLLVGFFVLNMFVGVVVENFHRCREEQEKEEKARRAAKRAKKLEKKRKKMREPPYYRNYSRTRLFIFNMVTSKYFDLAIAAVIGLNVVTMALEYYEMPQKLEYALQIFNYFFTAVFILESAMKMVALGCRRYIKDKWNQLDILIVILSVVGIVLEEMENEIIPINPTIIRVMRVMRIARVLKLLKMAKGIRALLDTVMQALPQVGNLGLLFFLLFFIFAALGVELFGRLDCDEEHPCQGLGEHAHFRNFGMAFLTLFRVATGDNWNGIMKDTIRDECSYKADCVKNCCLYPFVAPIFFVIFVLMAQFVLVNVVVAVLMKHLEESHKQMEDEYDIDVEIERQIAQEEEEMAEMQDRISSGKAEDNNKSATNPDAKVLSTDMQDAVRDHFTKMPALPSTFNCRGHRGSDPVISHTKGQRRNFFELTPQDKYGRNEARVDSKVNIVPVNEIQRLSPNLPVKFTLNRDPGDRPRSATSLRYTRSFSSASTPYGNIPSPMLNRSKNPPPLDIMLHSQPSTSGKFKHRMAKLFSDDSASIKEGFSGFSHKSQRQKQLRWSRDGDRSSCRYSNDDSVARSLVSSFEIFGRVDVDSTSCSICSSEECSSYSRYPSISMHSAAKKKRKAPLNFFGESFSTPQSSIQDDCDDTIASSNESFPIEVVPTDELSFDSTPNEPSVISSRSANVRRQTSLPQASSSLLKTNSFKGRKSNRIIQIQTLPGSAPQSPNPRKKPRAHNVRLKLTSSSEPYLLLPSHPSDR